MIPTRKSTPEMMARRFFLKKRWNKAIEQYQKCLQEDEANLAVVNLIGDAYFFNNDHDLAFEYYQKALTGYQEEGLFDNALAMAKKIARLNPSEASIHLKLAELYTDQSFLMNAITHLNNYIKSVGKRFDEPLVRAIFQKMAETPMENPDLWRDIGECYRGLEINDPELDQIMAPGSTCPIITPSEDTVEISHEIKEFALSDTDDQLETDSSLMEDAAETFLTDTEIPVTTGMDTLPDTATEEQTTGGIQLQDILSEVLPPEEDSSVVEIPTDLIEPHEEALADPSTASAEEQESDQDAADEDSQDVLMTLPYDEMDEISDADRESAAEEHRTVETMLTGFSMDEITVTNQESEESSTNEEAADQAETEASDSPEAEVEPEPEESSADKETVETDSHEEIEEISEEEAETEGQEIEKDLQSLELSELAELNRKEKTISPNFDGKEHMELGKIYREMKLWDAAIAEFKTAALDPRWRTTACIMLSECFQQKGELVLAISQLKWALSFEDEQEEDEDKYALHYELGSLFESAGDFSQAREHYQEVHRWNAKHRGVEKKLLELRKKMQTA